MSETLGEAGEAASDLDDTVVRVPANLMALIRQSYDSREKVLDWMLAIAVVAAMVYVFRDELRSCLAGDPSVNAGRVDAPMPSQDLQGAFPFGGRNTDRLYTYNMPSSRKYKYSAGPSGTRPPADPSQPPTYESEPNGC
jgi:hypothetical protein